MTPETQYARTADRTHVAYQVTGGGPLDIVVLRAWHSNLDHEWTEPVLAGIYRRLGSLGRVIRFDRRGTGLSDRLDPAARPTLEARVDDMRAVLDAAGSERAVLVGLAHGAALCAVFAATYPERTAGLVIYSPPRMMVGQSDPDLLATVREAILTRWGTRDVVQEIAHDAAPSRANDAAFIEWMRQDQVESGSPQEAVVQWDMINGTNIDGILSSIHVPTLVQWRQGSPNAGPYIAGRIPGALSTQLPGEDHVMISGDTRPWLGAVESFVEEVQGQDVDADRVLATVMFTDIVESTRLVGELGDRAWRDLVERHHAAVRRELARHRGREIDTAGDGFFAAFDGAARAIRCAAATRSAMEPIQLELRIGLHAGECERIGSGLRGVAVNLGARVAGKAGAGEILVSSTVRDLVAGSGIGFDDAGTHQLKGIPDAWQLYRVTSV